MFMLSSTLFSRGPRFVRPLKIKILVPLIVFVLGMCSVGVIVWLTDREERHEQQVLAQLNASAYAERVRNQLLHGVQRTIALQQVLISQNGKFPGFDDIAENLMTDAVSSLQLAPDGYVTQIHPLKGNEAGIVDLMGNPTRGRISRYARDNHVLTVQGPFNLKQGGRGIAIRNPLYLKDKSGKQHFWGFAIAIMRVPALFENSFGTLSKLGYEYRLSKTNTPWDTEFKVLWQTGGKLIDPASDSFILGDETWKFEVMPGGGWGNPRFVAGVAVLWTLIVLLMTWLTWALLDNRERKESFKKLAHVDDLTGIYNRYGFNAKAEKLIARNPGGPLVDVQLDVDDFKLINDLYGHPSGDTVLKSLAESLRAFFPTSALLGRTGGDEFRILLPNCTAAEAKDRLEQFAKTPKSFTWRGVEQHFSISIGYAEYPVDAKDFAQLEHCADVALYQEKMHGKNGCAAYRKEFDVGIRKRLGFALKDISENLPGAFIIYRADKVDDELFYANKEFLRMVGCDTLDELFAYTKNSFRNLIREDERQSAEASIWKQIEAGSVNDYVCYHLQKADGSYINVLDYGRIVESKQYGRVFYVLFADWEAMKVNFADRFSK